MLKFICCRKSFPANPRKSWKWYVKLENIPTLALGFVSIMQQSPSGWAWKALNVLLRKGCCDGEVVRIDPEYLLFRLVLRVRYRDIKRIVTLIGHTVSSVDCVYISLS